MCSCVLLNQTLPGILLTERRSVRYRVSNRLEMHNFKPQLFFFFAKLQYYITKNVLKNAFLKKCPVSLRAVKYLVLQ